MSKIRVGILIPKSKKSKIKLPDRILELCKAENIEITDIDAGKQNFDELDEFDVFLHKIVDFCNDDDTNEDEIRRKKELVLNYAMKYPNMEIVDHFENCEKISDREYQTEVLLDAQCQVDGIQVFVPKIIKILENSSVNDIDNVITSNKIRFPILCKPMNASMAEGSHIMTIVFAHENLNDVKSPCLLQEFRNHGGIIYKVFVVGDNYKTCQRPSVKDMYSCDKKSISFDTRNISKTGRAFVPELQESDPNNRQWLSCDDVPDMLNDAVVKEIIRRIKLKTKFHLFGFDILIDNETKNYALIDLNQFPGYSGIKPGYFDRFLVDLFKQLGKR